jgi:hypothetical protein
MPSSGIAPWTTLSGRRDHGPHIRNRDFENNLWLIPRGVRGPVGDRGPGFHGQESAERSATCCWLCRLLVPGRLPSISRARWKRVPDGPSQLQGAREPHAEPKHGAHVGSQELGRGSKLQRPMSWDMAEVKLRGGFREPSLSTAFHSWPGERVAECKAIWL